MVRAMHQPLGYWLLPSSAAGASGSAALQCYCADGDTEAVHRNHPGSCRKERGKSTLTQSSLTPVQAVYLQSQIRAPMQKWKLFQGQILVAGITHEHAIQVKW